MSLDQLRAMRDIAACHTAAAGTARWRCGRCGTSQFTFVGCSNRHCPACGATRAAQWLRNQCALILPGVTYHLVTFTVPDKLRRPIRSHPRELLDLLMRESSTTLLDLAANDRWVGGLPGLTAVLHTWTRRLDYHPHVHFIVTGGGLSPGGHWTHAHPRFLVPVEALSRVFRARFRDALRNRHPDIYPQIHPAAWRLHNWVVHSKPVGTGHTALAYLARYLHRVAICERAILHYDDTEIRLRYRDSNTSRPRTLRLTPREFLRRFLQHVLPAGFHKVRHAGLHHSSRRPLLNSLQAAMAYATASALPQPDDDPHHDAPLCPRCHVPMSFERRSLPQLPPSPFRLPPQNRGPPP